MTEIERLSKKGVRCMRRPETAAALGQGPIVPCHPNPEFITTNLKESDKIMYRQPKQAGEKEPSGALDVLPIQRVEEILGLITNEDAVLLGFDALHKINRSHPRNMIMRAILITPPVTRPANYNGAGTTPAFETLRYIAISSAVISYNLVGATHGERTIAEKAEQVYQKVKELLLGGGRQIGGRETKSVVGDINGKEGMLRKMMAGKRTNQCGRTVLSPDPSLKFGQIRIPIIWREVLTKRVRVNAFNRQHLINLMARGHITHITRKNEKDEPVRYVVRKGKKYALRIGDEVDRYLQNGDTVIINRQPTLHKQSLMGFEVVLGSPLTLGLHPSYCPPLNAD